MEKEGVAIVLEVFGDVVVGLWVLQKLYKGIWGLFHQQGALCILWGQRTPHNLQVLCPNMNTERGVDTNRLKRPQNTRKSRGTWQSKSKRLLKQSSVKCSQSICCLNEHEVNHHSLQRSWNKNWNISTRSKEKLCLQGSYSLRCHGYLTLVHRVWDGFFNNSMNVWVEEHRSTHSDTLTKIPACSLPEENNALSQTQHRQKVKPSSSFIPLLLKHLYL